MWIRTEEFRICLPLKANLNTANFVRVILGWANVVRANFVRVTFCRANGVRANCVRANCVRANCVRANLASATLLGRVDVG